MIKKLIKLIEREHITDLNTIARKMHVEKEFVRYIISLINKQDNKHILIVDDSIYMSSAKCSHCPFYKSS